MRIFLLCVSFFFFATTAFAQTTTSEFSIKVFAGTDDQPPTTPTLLSATQIGFTQLDLDWTTATDNFVLSGYVLFRGVGTATSSAVPIATTTLTSYSDVGLTPSTTYTYFVQAFDINSNYSTSSNALSVFVPPIPVPDVDPPLGEGTVARVIPEEVIVTPDVTSVDFDISTKFPSRIEIRWGRTTEYELGYIASDIVRREYETTITDLEPGTVYEYEIIGYTPFGRSNVLESGQFRTLDDVDLIAPANVKRFQAVAIADDVNLSWQMPDDDDIAYVRIVRSHLGYPVDPLDGATVYVGDGVGAIDRDVLLRYSPAYYTAFVYDTSGNISSGAIAIVYADSVSGDDSISDGNDQIPLGESDRELATTSLQMPGLFDFIIRQNSVDYTFGELDIELNQNDSFLIQLPSDRVTRNLKSIIIELQDPTDQRQSFSFLLRLNKDQSAYEAVIAPLGVVGVSDIRATIYDFRSLRVAEYLSQVSFIDIDNRTASELATENDSQLFWQFLLSIILLLLVFVWWILAKDRDEDGEEQGDEDKVTEAES